MLAPAAERFDALAMVKPQFEAGASTSAAAGWCATRRRGGRALRAVAACGQELGAAVLGFASSRAARPGGQSGDVRVAGRGRPRRADVEALLAEVDA